MKKSTREKIHKLLGWLYSPILSFIRKRKYDAYIRKSTEIALSEFSSLQDNEKQRVFYLGITAHANLGDMAQHYCICKWLDENYPAAFVLKIESDVVVDTRYGFIETFQKVFRPQDIIVFQSGYTTQDLGGNHEHMHRMIIEKFPDARILMMPQTIFYKHEENQKRCAENHNKARNMLFLARDYVSYEVAKKMFPNIHVKAFPDIVTTLIGTLNFQNERNGVCLCTRNDGEKFYSYAEIDALAKRMRDNGIFVRCKDTQVRRPFTEIRANKQRYIESEIETYSHYKVTITDRYHGTIFSLCAGTPVVVIKTTDHKVTTGADWFKGIYDDYIYVAADLADAYHIAKSLMDKNLSHSLVPYFKTEYYDKLKDFFEEIF